MGTSPPGAHPSFSVRPVKHLQWRHFIHVLASGCPPLEQASERPCCSHTSPLIRCVRTVARSHLKLDEFLPYRLSLASNAVSQVIAQAYEEHFGLKMHEWRVITVLAEDGELTQQEIVGRTKMDKVTVSRAAQVLERRKLLRRVTNAEDGRSLQLSLTAEGQKLYARVVPAALELEAEVLKGLSPREVDELKEVLRRLETVADRVLTRR